MYYPHTTQQRPCANLSSQPFKKPYRCRPKKRLLDERGATLALVALGMVTMLGMVALAVDVGLMLGRKTESQRTADAAALAGAASFISEPNNADRPRQWAIEYAEKNQVAGALVDVRPEDVDVLMDEKKVRVRVNNITSRGNAIPTIFARILGWNEMNVSTVAAARAFPAEQSFCPIPLAFPDRWDDVNGDNLYDPDEQYIPFNPENPNAPHTGYDLDDADYGTQLEIKTRGGPAGGGSGNSICVDFASWRCWFQPLAVNDNDPVGGGVDTLRPWIRHCPDPGLTIKEGDLLFAASGSGNKQSLMHTDGTEPEDYDFGDLVEEFPGVWGPNDDCPMVTELDENGDPTGNQVCAGPENLRVRSMPVVRPDQVFDTGSNVYAVVDKIICVWIDKVAADPNAPPSTVSGSAGRRSLYVKVYDGCAGEGAGAGEFLWDLKLVE